MKKDSGANWILIGVGTQLTSMIAAGFLLGYGLDTWTDTRPLFMIIFGCLGFVGGLIKVYELLRDL